MNKKMVAALTLAAMGVCGTFGARTATHANAQAPSSWSRRAPAGCPGGTFHGSGDIHSSSGVKIGQVNLYTGCTSGQSVWAQTLSVNGPYSIKSCIKYIQQNGLTGSTCSGPTAGVTTLDSPNSGLQCYNGYEADGTIYDSSGPHNGSYGSAYIC
jgi:hypothetical protein